MLPDVAGVDKVFDYLVPEHLADRVATGVSVRVPLHGRRVPGWVVEDDVAPPAGVRLLPLAAVRGLGPASDVVALARWAAWRWAGRAAALLSTASPPRLVGHLGPPADPAAAGAGRAVALSGPLTRAVMRSAFDAGRSVVRVPPAAPVWPAALAAAEQLTRGGSVLVLAPSAAAADRVGGRLAAAGWPVARVPDQWAEAAAGGRVVVGTRAAAWAPAPRLAAVVVLDGHDEVYKEERAPTWQAWQVAATRAEQAGAPCVVTSPCPTLELLEWGALHTLDRPAERAGWPVLEVVDQRGADPRTGLFSERLVRLVRDGAGRPGRPVVCVLNRRGRARLLACTGCGALARCELCAAALVQPRGADDLVCLGCGARRPAVCAGCGSTRLKVARPGVTRVAEELSALAGTAVTEVSSDAAAGPGAAAVVVGTEAVLHRVEHAAAVAFLEMDQELTAPRFRAAEQALALLARAGRLVGGRPGRVLVQTRLPDHEVLVAAAGADPAVVAAVEGRRRHALGLPPFAALAVLSGEGADELAARLRTAGPGLEIVSPAPGAVWVRAGDHRTLCDALAAAGRPHARVRVEVDPLRA